jgi:hypothetical protein
MQCAFNHRAPGGMDLCIGDHRHPPLAQPPAALFDQTGKQPGADPHLIGGAGDIDRDYRHCSIPFSTFATVRECGPWPLFTWIGAWA